MKLKTLFTTTLMASLAIVSEAQDYAVHFDMSVNNGQIKEQKSGQSYTVASQLPACTVDGLDGKALRFDGYSNYVKAGLPVSSLSTETLTINVILAAETYPMMKVDVAEETPTFGTIFGNLDEEGKTGFALELSSQGDLRLRVYVNYSGGYAVVIDGAKKLPRGQWNQITATFDKSGNAINLYLNGEQIGTKRSNRCELIHNAGNFYIGKDATDSKEGPFLINTFCGAIDDIAINNEVKTPATFNPSVANFNYPAERYADKLWRLQFHGMPSGGWTNESHGLIYSGGKYHVFFQKNANGPYMSRLHWGHISSENLYDWIEEPIAIYPEETYDIKGCWSGCVYEDGGDTYILYTAVDNAKARIAQAKAKDATLIEWTDKKVIIDGYSKRDEDKEDFRDPYYFEANGSKFIIVGSGKNGIGTCALYKKNGSNWDHKGYFFQGATASSHGTFWEMPNVTNMGNGKFLFTCTPLGTGVGVRTLCWIGTIDNDGKFTPESEVQYLEMGGISRDGFGLLSPSIYQKDGKTLLLGIVPDKLPTQNNYDMGWAHNYSLPREISLAADGSLIQKPYSGLSGMRTETSVSKELALTGIESLSPVSGRQIELLGEFTVASGTCGFNFLKSGSKQVSLTYDADNGKLTLDMTSLDRTSNDNDVYKGVYSATLPKKVNVGEKLTLHVYLDGSIADIFVNDTWAYSVRIFPNDAAQVEAEVFTTAQMQTKVWAWTLDAKKSGETGIGMVEMGTFDDNPTAYNLQGYRLNEAPQKGLYIKNGKKYVAR